MVRDLRTILDGWDYEPGKISARKIIGADRREKIQARVDLGVMQFEVDGRPDGKRPEACESLLQFHEQRLLDHERELEDDDGFQLGGEQCRQLRHEAYLYHQRYVSLFVLEEYRRVERDTEITLRVIDLCHRYAAAQRDREALSAYRNYAMMMNTRSRALQAAKCGDFEGALAMIDAGIVSLNQTAEEHHDRESRTFDNSSEIELLVSLREETIEQMPHDAVAKLQDQLAEALRTEDYERAAGIRDRIDRSQRDGTDSADEPSR